MNTNDRQDRGDRGNRSDRPPGQPGADPSPAPGSGGGAPRGPGPYCFTIAARVSSHFIGEVEGGYRVDLDYLDADGSLRIDEDEVGPPGLGDEARARLRSAALLSGNDWVFVSRSGVATFDSRITLGLARVGASAAGPGDPASPHAPAATRGTGRPVVSAHLRGRVDLSRCRRVDDDRPVFEHAGDQDVIATWIAGLGERAYVPLGLSVVFDVPSAGWKKTEDEAYRACRVLERHLFVGLGVATFGPGPHSPFRSFLLRVFRLDETGAGLDARPLSGRAEPSGALR